MKIQKFIALGLTGATLLTGASLSSPAQANSVSVQPIYRLYNKYTGEHFYTSSLTEKNTNIRAGWNYEGVGWRAPSYSTSPVYRVYNPNASGGDHYYTESRYEANQLVSKGWKWDNDARPVFYSALANQNDVFVAYNPNAQSGAHNYTTNLTEENNLLNHGWKFPATAWYGTTGNYSWNEGTRTYTNEDVTIKLGQITRTTDFEGKPAVKINFTITNHSGKDDDIASLFYEGFDVQQVTSTTSDSLWPTFDKGQIANPNSLTTRLRNGATISTYTYFLLENTSSPLKFSITENFDEFASFNVSL